MMDLHSTCISNSGSQIDPAMRELPEILRKKDVEINNLNKCNTELSETVVCLRQEIYALRKEKLNSEREWKDSRSKLLMVSERNAALVQELSKMNLENQKLKMEMLNLTKERCKPNLYSPAGQSDVPFNTYPWFYSTERSIAPFLSSPAYQVGSYLKNSTREIKDSEVESYEEISQKLFAQMKMEMEELDKQHCIESFSENEDICETCIESTVENILNSKMASGINWSIEEIQKVEDIISQLEHELIAVKLYALEQNRFIREMLQKVLNFTKANSPSPGVQNNGKVPSVHVNECSETEANDGRFQFPRPSDESFRAYFTQQLSSSGNQQPLLSGIPRSISEERLKTSQNVTGNNSNKLVNPHKGKAGTGGTKLVRDSSEFENKPVQQITADITVSNSNTSVKTIASPRIASPNRIPNLEDESKICPMCQAAFPKSTTQEAFEAHVFNHFEAENSILENFEVIQF